MGILNKFLKKKQVNETHKNNIDWSVLNSLDQLTILNEESKTSLIGVFKHSTRCAISTTVLHRFENNFPKGLDVKMYYLDLLKYREVSNEIGDYFHVTHQSPQLLLIKNKQVLKHASHYDILQVDLHELMK